jgi:hypothetical protein
MTEFEDEEVGEERRVNPDRRDTRHTGVRHSRGERFWGRMAFLGLMVVVAVGAERFTTEASRTRHTVNTQIVKINTNAVSLQELKNQIANFGRIFCDQQKGIKDIPVHEFPAPTTAPGQAFRQAIVTIQKSGEQVYFRLNCPNAKVSSKPPTQTPSPRPIPSPAR